MQFSCETAAVAAAAADMAVSAASSVVVKVGSSSWLTKPPVML